ELRETVIRNLQESLAVARTESDLFQQRWLEAQARAQTLGAHPGDTEAVAAHRQLLQALRQLTQAQAERQQLAELVQRLVQAIRAGTNLQAEAEAAETVLAGLQQKGNAPSEATAADLPAAQVLDVNPKLRVAVLDVGAEHGLRVGMPLQVLRGDRVIGALRVVEVRPRVSGALIESVRKGLTVRTGDVVRLARTLEVVPQ
ncbi:MAG: hypothetical protein N3B01_04135, partial [Verrucomicrobiae bacterium]|nr:hypothetical protein [Verrucomicrobiae bacterium]